MKKKINPKNVYCKRKTEKRNKLKIEMGKIGHQINTKKTNKQTNKTMLKCSLRYEREMPQWWQGH